MNGYDSSTQFQRGAIRPLECLRSGWELVKGDYWLLFGVTSVGILLGSFVPLGLLLGPMMCGIYLCLFQKMRGAPVRFEVLFKGFDFFVQSTIATLIQVVPIILIIVPFYIVFVMRVIRNMPRPGQRAPQINPLEFMGPLLAMFAVVMAVAFALGMFLLFVYPLIVDRRLKALAAITLSARAAAANLGGVIGLMAINFALGFAGLLCCYVGALFVLPVSFAALAVAYRRVFPEPTQSGTPYDPPYGQRPPLA